MEVFEVREQISETDNAADLMRLQTNIREDIVQIEKAFAGSLEGNNQTRALHYAVRLKYYSKVSEWWEWCLVV
jgi:DnaJ-domain-containing protein 1